MFTNAAKAFVGLAQAGMVMLQKTKVDPGTNNAPPKPTPDVSGSTGGAGGGAPKGGGKQAEKL